ncbi:MAG: hypothetical protein ACREGH_01005 [Minisyncoccia bacterium]
MDELTISGKRYISSRRAAKEFHYHADYIGQLIRAGKLQGQKVGRTWYVSATSLEEHFGKGASEQPVPKGEAAPAIHAEEPVPAAPLTGTPDEAAAAPSAPLLNPVEPKIEPPHLEEQTVSESKRELKMLTYLPDDINDSGKPLALLTKEKNISEPIQPSDPRPVGDTPLHAEIHPEPMSGTDEEETPIPLHITPTHPDSAEINAAGLGLQYPPYVHLSHTPNVPSAPAPSNRARAFGLFIMFVVLAMLAFGGAFFVSLLPYSASFLRSIL